ARLLLDEVGELFHLSVGAIAQVFEHGDFTLQQLEPAAEARVVLGRPTQTEPGHEPGDDQNHVHDDLDQDPCAHWPSLARDLSLLRPLDYCRWRATKVAMESGF